jgi:hypothetical protein
MLESAFEQVFAVICKGTTKFTVLTALLFSSIAIVGLFLVGHAIWVRETRTCQPPPADAAAALAEELSRFHPESVVKFAVPYSEGRDQITTGSVDKVWLFQMLKSSGWDVDWFQTDIDLKVSGFCIVVNDSSVLPPASLELARILSHHSIMIRWIEDPRIVSWTNEWCVYVGC